MLKQFSQLNFVKCCVLNPFFKTSSYVCFSSSFLSSLKADLDKVHVYGIPIIR